MIRSPFLRKPLLVAALTAPVVAFAQPPCRVLDPELQGSYSGPCREGLAHGQGVAQGHARYEGGFEAGAKHGRGVKSWPNGDRYEGEFFEDHKHGSGTYTWGNGPWRGERYRGEYRFDRREGHGVYEWPGADRYVGPWKDDVMTGPPTPMMRLRAQAGAAARAALSVPGLRVCQDAPLGLVARDRISGTVADFDEHRLAVRIDRAGENAHTAGGVAVRPGEVVWDAFLAWEPC